MTKRKMDANAVMEEAEMIELPVNHADLVEPQTVSRAERRRIRARDYARRRYDDPEFRERKRREVLDRWHRNHPEARRYRTYEDPPTGNATMVAAAGGILGLLVGMAIR